MTEEIKNNLEKIIGVPKIYKGKKHVFSSFKEINGTIVIFSDGQTYSFLLSEIYEFLKEVEIMSMPEKPNQVQRFTEVIINGYSPTEENKSLKDALIGVLKEIKNNPSKNTISKAKSIVDISNAVVNIQKTEIQMINLVKKSK